MEKTLYATEEAYRMVMDDGIPFREAYRRVAERLGKGER
jgi:argininosuccinate lyase